MPPVHLVTLAPGHFHAALVQMEHVPDVAPHTHIYAPLDADLVAHLERIAQFNARADQPFWTTSVHAGDDWRNRFRRERPGNVVIIAGRNRAKIQLIREAVALGYCVLADKPWIVEAEDFPKLEAALAEADRQGVFVRDIMTERWEVTTRIQRDLMGDLDIFGELLNGTADEPALHFESVHYLSKNVAGVPLRRPAWWFDPAIAGEAVADVGTHLADLAMWLGFPGVTIDFRHDIEVVSARRWPTLVDRESFRQITGLADFPNELIHLRDGDRLIYWGNGTVLYKLRGRYVRLTTLWGIRADRPEGDTHLAVARGSNATIAVRHAEEFGPGPHVFVEPTRPGAKAAVDRWAVRRPTYALADVGGRSHVAIPESERAGHESHFASVLREFVAHFADLSQIPAWERTNVLAKYHVTTHALALARRT